MILFRILRFCGSKNPHDLRSQIRFWILPKKRTLLDLPCSRFCLVGRSVTWRNKNGCKGDYGSPDKCWLHTCDACVIRTWRFGVRAPLKGSSCLAWDQAPPYFPQSGARSQAALVPRNYYYFINDKKTWKALI